MICELKIKRAARQTYWLCIVSKQCLRTERHVSGCADKGIPIPVLSDIVLPYRRYAKVNKFKNSYLVDIREYYEVSHCKLEIRIQKHMKAACSDLRAALARSIMVQTKRFETCMQI